MTGNAAHRAVIVQGHLGTVVLKRYGLHEGGVWHIEAHTRYDSTQHVEIDEEAAIEALRALGFIIRKPEGDKCMAENCGRTDPHRHAAFAVRTE